MTIFSEQLGGPSMPEFGGAISSPVISVSTIPQGIDMEFCVDQCCYVEHAFAYPTDPNDEYRADKTDILITLLDGGSTFEFRLIKPDGTFEVLNDNTYGTYFPPGTYPDQPLKTGYVIDWTTVFNLLGAGTYQIEADQTDFGTTTTATRWDYEVSLFDEKAASRTVKIKTFHEGIVQNGEDYEGVDWTRYIRIPANFGKKNAILESDAYETSTRQLRQISDKVLFEYTLESELLIAEVINRFLYDRFLANRMFISSYGLYDHETFFNKEVYAMPNDFEPNYFETSPKAFFSFTMRDIDQSTLKRNV